MILAHIVLDRVKSSHYPVAEHKTVNWQQRPSEQKNLADERAGMVAELQALLDVHQADDDGPLYNYEIESPQPIDITGADVATKDDEYVWGPN